MPTGFLREDTMIVTSFQARLFVLKYRQKIDTLLIQRCFTFSVIDGLSMGMPLSKVPQGKPEEP